MARERPNAPGNAPVSSDDSELESLLSGQPQDDGAGDYGMPAEFSDELNTEVALDGYDLSQSVGLDLRPLKTGFWYPAICAQATPGLSQNGNPQISATLEVTGPGINLQTGEKHDTSEGGPVVGITVQDQLPTPRPPLTPKKINSLYKLKMFAHAFGLAVCDANGNPVKLNPGTKASDFVGKALLFKCEVDTQFNPDQPRNKVAFGQYRAPNVPKK